MALVRLKISLDLTNAHHARLALSQFSHLVHLHASPVYQEAYQVRAALNVANVLPAHSATLLAQAAKHALQERTPQKAFVCVLTVLQAQPPNLQVHIVLYARLDTLVQQCLLNARNARLEVSQTGDPRRAQLVRLEA